jgi:hypothetical protein
MKRLSIILSFLILILIPLNFSCTENKPHNGLNKETQVYWNVLLLILKVNRCPQTYTLLDAGTHVIHLKQNEAYYFDIKPRLSGGLFKDYIIDITEQPGQNVSNTELEKCIRPFTSAISDWDGGPFRDDQTPGLSYSNILEYGYEYVDIPGGYLKGIKLMTAESDVTITIPSDPTH